MPAEREPLLNYIMMPAACVSKKKRICFESLDSNLLLTINQSHPLKVQLLFQNLNRAVPKRMQSILIGLSRSTIYSSNEESYDNRISKADCNGLCKVFESYVC